MKRAQPATVAPWERSGQARGAWGWKGLAERRLNVARSNGSDELLPKWRLDNGGIGRGCQETVPIAHRGNSGRSGPGNLCRASDRTPWQSPRALPTTCSVGPQITRACNCPGDRGSDSGGCGLPSAWSQYPPPKRCVPAIPHHSTRDRWLIWWLQRGPAHALPRNAGRQAQGRLVAAVTEDWKTAVYHPVMAKQRHEPGAPMTLGTYGTLKALSLSSASDGEKP